ncbi:glycosyltransferase family 4 protein [Rhodovulum sp. FJ3]|uniref:glycosyltransferase family 4 protein n=1 Tax=Rhodovulum sp. FJ3 TaxID=3079053 RepID=UPI00293DCFDC|nr:glycosyltransferase family 4 protein [Rhodovulum sp. FJ3]MDV4166757.1 glycosyltransferase family 4 protein [Rhodovulum sp. FJ3]
MRALHICETIKGGVATYLTTFDALCHDQVESRFIVPQEHVDQLPVDDAAVIPYARSKRGPRAVLNLAKTAQRAVRDFEPDILFFHSTFSLGALLALRARRVPGAFVYIPHGWARLRYTEAPKKARIVSAVEGRLAGSADLVLNISKNDQALAKALSYRGRHIVVENALQDLKTLPEDSPFEHVPGRINLLFVGRFDRQKGLDILLEAFPRAAETNPALHLHVVGASVLGEGKGAASNHPSITFHDWVPPNRISDYHAGADMLVMPSRWEGLPMVLIEALRAGTPVMASDTSGLGELISPGNAGIAVAPDVESFAQALASLTPQKLAAMRAPARTLYETRYGAERFRQETLTALEDL